MGLNVVVATPTHKANAQITKALRAQGAEGFEPMTIHRLLGLEYAQCFNTGTESFVRQKDGELVRRRNQEDSPVEVVIVDETSMLSEEHYRWLLEDAGDASVIFVGDDRQLVPISDGKLCSAFRDCDFNFRLDKVMRHDGAILNLATQIRKLAYGRPRYEPADSQESQVIVYTTQQHWLDAMLDVLTGDTSMMNADHARVLCFNNKSVKRFNQLVHAARFGEDAPEYQPGMALITHSNVQNPITGGPLYPSAFDLTLEDAERTRVLLPGLGEDENWDCWRLLVKSATDLHPVEIFAIPREAEKEWNEHQRQISERAKKAEDRSAERAALWRLWFTRKHKFASLQPAASLTVHKSQGSTFEHVFLCNDIDNSGKLVNRLAYVGATRPSSSLHVFQP